MRLGSCLATRRAARISREQEAAQTRYTELRKLLLEKREGTLGDFANLSRVARLAFAHEREFDAMDGA